MAGTDISDQKVFSSVKIDCPDESHDEWPIIPWAEAYVDQAHPYMVVLHVMGADRQPHWHIVCVPKVGVSHLKVDQDAGCPHPGRGRGKKPIQAKHGYDKDHFNYLLKPKEFAKQGDAMICWTSFTAEEIVECVALSKEYAATLKTAIHDRIQSLPTGLPAQEFHMKALSIALCFCKERKREPGPWLTHKVRFAVWTRDVAYKAHIEGLYR